VSDHTHELRFFADHLESREGQSVSLSPAVRVVFVETGVAEINGQRLNAGEGSLVLDEVELILGADDVRLARWELVPNGTPYSNPVSDLGSSLNKRTDFIAIDGDETGIRLDTVTFPPGTRAYRHIHASCGIRYLLRGSLEINTDHGLDLMEPGQPWFEAVNEPVLAIADAEVETQFVRMMVLPVDYHGKLTITYVDPADDDKPREQINNRLLDEIVSLA